VGILVQGSCRALALYSCSDEVGSTSPLCSINLAALRTGSVSSWLLFLSPYTLATFLIPPCQGKEEGRDAALPGIVFLLDSGGCRDWSAPYPLLRLTDGRSTECRYWHMLRRRFKRNLSSSLQNPSSS
jgi:hypothetical protein